jgi:hypothetical protein
MMMQKKFITNEAINRLADKIEKRRANLNRIGESSRLVDENLIKISQELDEKIMEFMKLQLLPRCCQKVLSKQG